MAHSSPGYLVNNNGGGGAGGAAAVDAAATTTTASSSSAVALPPLHTVHWAEKQYHHRPLTVASSSSPSPSSPSTSPSTPSPGETTCPASASSDGAPRRKGGEPTAAGPPPPVALDWETYKDTIKDLYMGQNLNLNQVVERMRAYDFHATPRMYKAQFARWGWSKYNCKRMRRDISSGKAVEKSVGKSCHRVKRQRASKAFKGKESSSAKSKSLGASANNTTSTSTSTAMTMTTTTATTNTAMPIARRRPAPQISVTSYQIAHANDASRCIQAVLSDIRGHVYSFFSRKPDWQQSPGTGLISAYNYSFYDSFRIALDSFLKNEHFNGGEILRQAFVEAEEAIQTDYSSTFYFFFIDLPDLFLHYGRHDIFVILMQHINRLTAVSLRDKIIGAGFASLHALARSNPAFLRYYIAAASGLWSDLLKELRGPSDRSTLLARRNHIRHAQCSDRARVTALCDDYDHLLGEIKNRWGAGHNASRHMEDVILLTQLNYGHFMDNFVERNERLIEDVGRKYQLASSATTSPVAPVSIESHSNAGDGKFETLPLEAWDIIDRNIRSNCYHRLSCFYVHQGRPDRASLCSRKAREGWKSSFWQLEVEGALVEAGRLFEADTLRRLRLEAQYFKKLPVNDWSIASAELDYYLNIRPSLLRTMSPTAGGAWAPSLGYGNAPGSRHNARS
ncbi:hypothetical protein VSDG_03537 [Cytospora chrysosperma]|uniref:Clr5 domain-containing protein n=1 Tax=Cytospora chrysosperma TaxID=252740 RepID=A0A423W9P2_CYTCH|nr:hypothetical protein VSDG_03537 [Valsa sordida]